MGFRFRRRIKILSGLHVNIGKKGVTGVTVGSRDTSVSTSKRGTRMNISTGIPGLSYSRQIGGKTGTRRGASRSYSAILVVALLLLLIWLVRR